ncbi:MAG: alpha/beta fold hydrolase [Segniliparus sp.]|uniref:alpha/beta fold hydrolase n=1 Tax=Segniliparus sp. TaxID=2804064 RepID=UPI003F370AD6
MASSKLRRAQRITLLSGAPLAVLVVLAVLVLAGGVACWTRAASAQERAKAWTTLPQLGPEPEGGRVGHAPVNGIDIWYAVYGPDLDPAADKPPVLLLHGGLADSEYWNGLVPALVAKGRTVIAMDSRGHGRTTRSAEPYSYGLMAEDVQLLLRFLQVPKVDLVGWSDGGIVGLELAIEHPELLSSLFAYGANARPDGLVQGGDQSPVFVLGAERAHQEFLRVSPHPQGWDSFNERIKKMWDTQPDISDDQLRSIHVRTAIADGQYDEVIKREHTEHLAATIPGARLEVLPDVSHFGMLQNPEEFNKAVLDFLG